MIVWNPYPGALTFKDSLIAIYECLCVSMFSESEIKNICNQEMIIVPSIGANEPLQYMGGLLCFNSYHATTLTLGTDMCVALGTVILSDPIPATTFLAESEILYVPSIMTIEPDVGLPITLRALSESVFEDGDNSSTLTFVTVYRRRIPLGV